MCFAFHDGLDVDAVVDEQKQTLESLIPAGQFCAPLEAML